MLTTVRNLFLVLMVLGAIGVFLRPANQGGDAPGDRTSSDRASPDRAARAAASRQVQQSPFRSRVELERSPNGHYYVTAEVDGVDVQFLVDTGASMVALTREDADRIGLDPDRLEYSLKGQTANGISHFAPVTLDEIEIENIAVSDVRAAVSQSSMGISLLGMSFLGQLDGFQVEDGNLILLD